MASKFSKLLNILILFVVITFNSCADKNTGEQTVKDVMDETVTKLYKTMTEKQLDSLTNDQVMALFNDNEKEVLATRHWMFDVNVPVVVSVMRSTQQKTVPFWLAPTGFVKTSKTMKNEEVTYEVWQKNFDKGHIGLGVNGFEDYMLHYFVSVAPQNKNDQLELSNFFPADQYVEILQDSAFTYHDWTELVLINVPGDMKGQKLLTTIRGRGTESHLIGAFRKTAYPSSSTPDQVMLTWSDDPATSIDVQWRTDTTVDTGKINYREKGSDTVQSVAAEKYRMEDRDLMNDRFINRFTAKLKNLKPGTTYEYQIPPQTNWNEKYTFSTPAQDSSFSFVWTGDTHHSPTITKLYNLADQSHPDAAFYSIAGDMVSEGLHRDQWDDLFQFSKDVICRKPLMAVIGNHDTHQGLGAWMYRDLFSYPKNAPAGVQPEHTYSFRYKNALFLMIESTAPIDSQKAWIEDQLAKTDATWKFAMFHFAPYNWDEPYPDIQAAWIPLFDKYHVDMVMNGHIHYYMRTKPMKGGKVVGSYNEGTAYVESVAIPTKPETHPEEPYAVLRNFNGDLYQYVKIEGNTLSFTATNADNKVIDSFTIKK
ncbi:fibronectin type III domain-containing protein [Parafilimonas sp.]|uniref:fibronectin type III domain-containing protein n=1 Tax=Parafilimonas sp. TaxID=1969739 RepID=UPI003F7DFCCC